MEDKALVTPAVLKWARVRAKMSLLTTSKQASISVDNLRKWEKGITCPTIREAQELARIYRRPFAILFLPEIPRGFRLLRRYYDTSESSP